ncbi:microcephalin-like isoform X2 [Daktulosphaira vitifoliae]|uniref:microcephalin-like isoform X2 n=1 Tax=Daktulosphaira vitifoliae TaxID=58002 RepID=UPI0021AA09C3|nr:microcephalin-like isoform X2 [Daktulosphaira vitifoliae]
MSVHITYPRDTLQRLSDRKNRKLAIDDSFNLTTVDESDPWILCNSQVDVIEASESPLKEHRDLFGEVIHYESPLLKNKTNSSTPGSRKRKQYKWEEVIEESPITRPKRAFIPTPRIVKLMKEAQVELYSVMGHSKSSSDVSIVSEDSLNVSGVQNLSDSPQAFKNKSEHSKEESQSPPILEGVVAFVDYKIDNDRSGIGVKHRLTELGAKIEKTFNQKVTHVVFRDGYRATYRKAIERNIPLVSARWVEGCKISNTLLDPANYPPVDLEKYQKTPEIDFNHPKYNKYKKFLRPSDAQRDEMLKTKCSNLMNRINALMGPHDENEDKSYTETPKKETKKEPEDPFKTNDIISVLSDQLSKVLNTNDSPISDDHVDELYLPMSIKLLRKYLTPKGSENKTPAALDSDLIKIEDRLKLNSRARQRLRKLLFPDVDLSNVSNISDFPTPSPQKIRISAPARLLTSKKKPTKILVEKINNENNIKEKIAPENYVNKQTILDNNNKKRDTPENNVLKHIKQWKIPSDLRPKKVKTISKPVENNKQTKLTSWLSRDSSVFFQTPKESLASSIALQTIVCTGLKKSEVDIIQQSIDNLGIFNFSTKVEPSTTYVVTKPQPNRTLNLVYAMAFGCYIVSEGWVHDSHKEGRWLSHIKYLVTNLSEPVKTFQKQKNTFGSLLTFHIFDTAGKIYISDSCEPPAKDLKRLVRTCGGNITNNVNSAKVVIGSNPKTNFNVNEKWILDCITQVILKIINFSQVPFLRRTSQLSIMPIQGELQNDFFFHFCLQGLHIRKKL